MQHTEIREMLGYHYWAHREVWGCVEKLTEAQFNEDLHYSQGSIQRQCVHTMIVERFWLDIIRDTVPQDQKQAYNPRPYTTRPLIRAAWDELEMETYAYVDSVDEGAFNETIRYEFPFSGPQSHPRWRGIFYVVQHGIDHRAQILAGIHRLGGETLMQDYTSFMWGR